MPMYVMPDGNEYPFDDDAEATEALNAWDTTPEYLKDKEFMEKWQRKAAVSTTRGSFPEQAAQADFLAGLTSMARPIASAVGLDKYLPSEGANRQTPEYLLGSLSDPLAWITGTKAMQGASAVIKSPVVANILGGAAGGATIGAVTEEGTAASGAAVGGAVGALLPVFGKAATAAANVFKGVEQQTVKHLTELFPNPVEREAAAKALLALKGNVPGERPTTGMAAVTGDMLIPGLKTLEETARKNPKLATQLINQDAKNEAARVRVLEWIAKPGQRPPAGFGEKVKPSMVEAARTNITGPLYAKAMQDTVPVDEVLEEILSGPHVKSAAAPAIKTFEQLLSNAKVIGKPSTPIGRSGTPSTYEYVPEWSVNAPVIEKAGKPAEINLAFLKGVQDNLKKAMVSAKDDATRIALTEARSNLNKWMYNRSPAYKDAQDTFSFLSEAGNQAAVADVLERALKSSSGKERADTFLTAMREAPKTVKKGVGNDYFEEIGQVLSPTQMKQVQAIAKSLEQQQAYARLGTATPPKMVSEAEQAEKAVPGLLNASITTFRKVLSKVGGKMSQEASDMLDNIVANDPKKLADLLRKANKQERKMIVNHFKTRGLAVSTGTAISNE